MVRFKDLAHVLLKAELNQLRSHHLLEPHIFKELWEPKHVMDYPHNVLRAFSSAADVVMCRHIGTPNAHRNVYSACTSLFVLALSPASGVIDDLSTPHLIDQCVELLHVLIWFG